MKRRILITLISAAVICAAGAFAACVSEEHTHTWNDGEVTLAATCSTAGEKTYTCTGCKETKTEIIPKNNDHPHSEEWLKNGVEHWQTATCEEHNGERVNVGEHDFGEGEVITPATCLKTGLKKYTCICGETKSEIIEKTAHTFVEYSTDDNKHWRVCTTDGCNEISDEHAHNWDNGEITTPATCLSEGVKTFTCADCKLTKTESVERVGHSYGEEWSADENGHFHACTFEGCTEKTDLSSHTYGEWITGDLMYKPCVVCGYHYLADTLTDMQPVSIMLGGDETTALALLTRSTGYYTVACNLTANAVFNCRYWDIKGKAYEKTVTLTPEENSFTLKLEGRGTCYITIVSEAATAAECSATLTYVGATLPGHTHSYSTEWSKDEIWHWHACTGEDCEEETDSGEHDYENGVCKVCGYSDT